MKLARALCFVGSVLFLAFMCNQLRVDTQPEGWDAWLYLVNAGGVIVLINVADQLKARR